MRNLKALEIAEGALLADIAVLFQLLTIYLPVGGGFFRVPIFIAFAVLVLRQSLYVGILSLCVALFVASILVGSHSAFFMILECTGGLFLGVGMKRRMHFLPLLLVGVTCGAFSLYCLSFIATFLSGLPVYTLTDALYKAYLLVISFINILTAHIGLWGWWRHNLYPPISSLADIAFRYWLLSFYVVLWIFLWPVVFVIYVVTNFFVRMLGYDVIPFPGGRLGRFLRRLKRRNIRLALKWGLLKGRVGRA